MTTTPKTPKDEVEEAASRALEADPVYLRTRARVLYAGAAILLASMLGIFIPMLVAVGRGISSGEVWDPYTKEKVGQQGACVEQAGELLVDAGKGIDSTWTTRHTSWVARCQDGHTDLGALLERTAK
ncbi:MAG: hypothetical protein AAGI01_14055 [Myxococcota bacterium]